MVIACYQVFNEIDYLEQSLKSIYDFVDKIYLFECCYETMRIVLRPGRVTPDGLSGDGTTELIKNFPDPDKKINHIPLGFVNTDETKTYSRILDIANIDDYIWYIGGDEVYPKEMAEKVRDVIDSKKYSAMWLYHYLFWHDFYHVKTGGLNHQMVIRKINNRMYYDPRVSTVRWHCANDHIHDFSQLAFNGYTVKYDCQGSYSYMSYVPELPDLYYFHYAYVRNAQRLLEKILWQYFMMIMPRKHADKAPNEDTEAWKKVDEYQHSLQYRSPLEFKLKTFDWFGSIKDDIARVNFRQPDSMSGHKYSSRWDELPTNISIEKASEYVNNIGFNTVDVSKDGVLNVKL